MNAEPFSIPTAHLGRIAVLWRAKAARRSGTPDTSWFKAVFAALTDVGIDAVPVVYEDDVVDAVRAQLVTLDGVLVWVNPIHEGRNRANLDALLREVAARGVWVSAPPDVILKMGTKEVLHRTRTMSWGSDTAPTAQAMRVELPARLAGWPSRDQAQPWQRRPGRLESREAGKSTQPTDGTPAGCYQGRTGGAGAGRVSRTVRRIFRRRLHDRSAVPSAPERRCGALLHGRRSLRRIRPPEVDAPAARAEAGPSLYTSNADPRFQRLRRLMEDEWAPQLTSLVDVPRRDLPMIWDADFRLGPPGADGTDRYVLGEINVSSVLPIPDEASAEIARRVADRLLSTFNAACRSRQPAAP
jgi:hypothetical protein